MYIASFSVARVLDRDRRRSVTGGIERNGEGETWCGKPYHAYGKWRKTVFIRQTRVSATLHHLFQALVGIGFFCITSCVCFVSFAFSIKIFFSFILFYLNIFVSLLRSLSLVFRTTIRRN